MENKEAFLEGLLIGLYQELIKRNECELADSVKKDLKSAGVTIGNNNKETTSKE